jgi:hypothetical protein
VASISCRLLLKTQVKLLALGLDIRSTKLWGFFKGAKFEEVHSAKPVLAENNLANRR